MKSKPKESIFVNLARVSLSVSDKSNLKRVIVVALKRQIEEISLNKVKSLETNNVLLFECKFK